MINNIAIITDLHFGCHKNSEDYFNSQKNFLVNQFIPYLKENSINTIFFLGDLFDNRNTINTKIQNDVFDLFNEHFNDFIIYMLIGNHDIYYTTTVDINSIKFLSKFENIKIINKIEVLNINNKKLLMVPWIVDYSEFINYIHDKSFDACFGHFDINGFHYNKQKISDNGIDSSIFKNKCNKIFSGHFHIRSKQNIDNTEIIYVGSPYQLTRNDINEERGFAILDLNDLSYKFVNNNQSMKFIKLQYPQSFSEDSIKNNIIDIYVKYDENYNEDKIQSYVDKINELKPAFNPQIIIETDENLNNNINLSNIQFSSIPDLMQQYINTIEIKNKENIITTLNELYNLVK